MFSIIISFLVGALVGITGTVASNLFILPIREQRKSVAEIANTLEYYANVIFNPCTLPPEETTKVQ